MPDLTHLRTSPVLTASPGVRMLPHATRYVLRGGPQVMLAAGDALGLVIASEPCRSTASAKHAALWLGPDEQLLIGQEADGSDLGSLLREKLAGLPCSIVDISHRQIALEISGPHAQTLLSVGCPLDLDTAGFPRGMCTRTLLGKANVVLWRTQTHTFHLEIWRSFADYVTRFLAEAGRELAC